MDGSVFWALPLASSGQSLDTLSLSTPPLRPSSVCDTFLGCAGGELSTVSRAGVLTEGRTYAFPFLICLPVRRSPSWPWSLSASCTPSRPSLRRHMENYCPLTPLADKRTRALRLLAPPLEQLLAPLLRETSKWILKRSTSTCHPSPTAAMALSFPQLVRRKGEGAMVVESRQQVLTSSYLSRHPPPESAVVLDLLMSLPEELSHLPCAALVEHMMDTYLHLMAPQSDPSGGNLGPGAEVCGTGSRGQEESSQATPQAPENARPSKPRSAWQVVGICPLNPFLVPLELLGQVATPAK